MILQVAIGVGMYVLLFAGTALLIFTPVVSLLVYRTIDWAVKKRSGFSINLTGSKKVLLVAACILLGASLTVLMIAFFFLVVLSDFRYE
ncbi:MAG: hypothetical protein K0S23_384 [Fluviicola sp.]|jgi:hypothetical protein|uniref:hypothetical protein n=1 Tax=Fluviicola sp. TaxID=1917219 RepID=UPI002623D7C4|nr:hypothetical protein [Fluviicola sp.]MDF3026077.1 hypothetical protein [Fluviicola sp.]